MLFNLSFIFSLYVLFFFMCLFFVYMNKNQVHNKLVDCTKTFKKSFMFNDSTAL